MQKPLYIPIDLIAEASYRPQLILIVAVTFKSLFLAEKGADFFCSAGSAVFAQSIKIHCCPLLTKNVFCSRLNRALHI